MKVQIGDRIKFVNMPASYPYGTVTSITLKGFKYKLDTQVTSLGYSKPLESELETYKQNRVEQFSRLKSIEEHECLNENDIEVIGPRKGIL